MTDDLGTLIAYRMEQAEDALRAADLLLKERLWRDVVNRAYYGAFYTVLALLAMKGLGTSKHTPVRSPCLIVNSLRRASSRKSSPLFFIAVLTFGRKRTMKSLLPLASVRREKP